MFSHSVVWASVPFFALQVAARGLVHQAEVRDAAVNEAQGALGGLLQRLSPFKKREFCMEDAWYTAVSTHMAGESYCADLLSKTHETSIVFVTPTTTVTSTTGTRTFVKTQTARVTSTVVVTTTMPASMKQKRGPQPTAPAKLKRQAPPASVANNILSAFEAGSTILAPTNRYAEPSLTSACNCVYPGAAITDTVTSTDYFITSTIVGYDQELTTTTSTTIVRTVTTTSTLSLSSAAAPTNPYYGGGGPPSSSTSSSVSISMSISGNIVVPSSSSSSSSSMSSMSSAMPPPPPYYHPYPDPVPSSSSSSSMMMSSSSSVMMSNSSSSTSMSSSSMTMSSNSSSSSSSSMSSSSMSISMSYNGSFTTPGPYPSNNVTTTMINSTTSVSSTPIPIYTSWDGEFFNASTTPKPPPYPTTTPISMSNSSSMSVGYNGSLTISSSMINTSTTPCTTSTSISIAYDGEFFNASTSSMYKPSNTTSAPYPLSTDNCTTTSTTMSSHSSSMYMNSTSGCSMGPPVTYTTTATMYSTTITQYITMMINSTSSTMADGEVVTPIPDSVSASSSSVPSPSLSSSPKSSSVAASSPGQSTPSPSPITTYSSQTSHSQSPSVTGCINLGNQIKNGDFESQTNTTLLLSLNDPTDYQFTTDDPANVFFFDALSSAQQALLGSRVGRFESGVSRGSGTLTQNLTLCPDANYELKGYVRINRFLDACQVTFTVGGQQLYTIGYVELMGSEGVFTPLGVTKENYIGGADGNVALSIDFECYGDPDLNSDTPFATLDLDDLSLIQVTE